ncbi:MAG: flagellar basal body protein [Roseateles depolymerans]|uniref:Flagellar protein FliL n=1 Tax=Roseateles depolymerans TaxID=76731 RepID=A0A2W5E2C1_9BURK|nr:MAG: flagellar basal body protein [Roseateles depolymerans]
MSKAKLGILIGVIVLLLAGGGGAGWWWWHSHAKKADGAQAEVEEIKPAPEYKYVTLDKVLVMLRGSSGEAVSHYMAVDIVFKTLPDKEKLTKEHLPLLRTVAVKALSTNTLDAASAMSVEDVAKSLNQAYQASYKADGHEPPFAEALIGKLIIE